MPRSMYDGFAQCVECGQPIQTGQEYYTSKPKRTQYTLYIHKECYENLLPKPTNEQETELKEAG